MVDMHIHTTCSDGTKTVEEVLKQAEKIGLDYISITDHETCRAYQEIKQKNLKEYYSRGNYTWSGNESGL